MKTKRTKLIAATFTPMDSEGKLALTGIDEHFAYLKKQGAVDGVFICGTTGEGVSLTSAERRLVAERWMTVADESMPVMVHVGHTSVEESRLLAEHAQNAGASGVAAIGPFYFRPATVADLVDHCAVIAGACSATPFYYYHIPLLTGVNLSMPEFLSEATKRMPNFAGIKYTDNNLMDFALCRDQASPDQEMLFGWDEIMLSALASGASGFVGSTYSYVAPLYRKLIDAFESGNMEGARDVQRVVQGFVKILQAHGGLAAGKGIMNILGIDHGPPRLPLRGMSPQSRARMEEALKAIGFWGFCRT